MKYPYKPVETSLGLESFSNLRELNIFYIGENIKKLTEELPKLSKLEVLDLAFASGESELIAAVSQLKKLRVLRLMDCGELNDINPVMELKELCELSIDFVKAKHFDLIKIVDRLVNLTKLSIFIVDCKIQKQTYRQLVNAVERRPVARNRVLELCCPFTDDFNDILRPTVKLSEIYRR